MTPNHFRTSLSADHPPAGLQPALEALWWAGKEDWERAHALVQDEAGAEAAWVHAHLHRVEGDLANAAYWYRRAGCPVASSGLDQEWLAIVAALLAPDTTPDP
jgi:hypothetical protein